MSPVDWQQQDRSVVALVKAPYRDTKQQTVDRVVRESVEHLGGIRKFVREGQVVAIKPNQTFYKLASQGITTSTNVVAALVAMCREAGAREVLVTEAAGHGLSTRKMMEITGMADAAREAGAQVIYLEEVSQRVVDFGEGAPVRYMPVPEILERVDVFIDCPKAKTHFVDPITGACKNYVGLMPMSIRQWAQKEVNAYYQGTAQLLRRYRPALTVCDGMIAGEGQGPSGSRPFWWGFVMASDDPVAADVTLARLFSLDWRRIRMAEEAATMGVGAFDPEKIDIKGIPFEDAVVQVQPSNPGMDIYPCRTIVGTGAGITLEGTLGHWKAVADSWLQDGAWTLLTRRGTPTFMFGEADDPMFEQHLKEGPYVVLGDSARDQYKMDPRVTFLPGSPVPQTYIMHDMVRGMGFASIYEPGMDAQQEATQIRGRLTGLAGEKSRKSAILKGIAAAVAVAAAVPVVTHYTSRQRESG